VVADGDVDSVERLALLLERGPVARLAAVPVDQVSAVARVDFVARGVRHDAVPVRLRLRARLVPGLDEREAFARIPHAGQPLRAPDPEGRRTVDPAERRADAVA